MAIMTMTPFGDSYGFPGGLQSMPDLGDYFKAAGSIYGGRGDRGLVVSKQPPPSRTPNQPLIKGDARVVIAHDNEVVMTPKQLSQVRPVGDPRTFKPEQLDAMRRAMETYGTDGHGPSPVATLQPRRGASDNLNSSVVPQFDKGGLIRNGGVTEKEVSPGWLKKKPNLTLPATAPSRSNKMSMSGSDGGNKCPMCGQPIQAFSAGGASWPMVTMEHVTPGLGAAQTADDQGIPLLADSSLPAQATFQRRLASILNPGMPGLTV